MPVLSNSQAGYPAGLKHYTHLRSMPRLGFAYRPTGSDKTVISAGFGMYNITLLGANCYSLTGILQAQTTQYTNTFNSDTHVVGLSMAVRRVWQRRLYHLLRAELLRNSE